MPRIIASPTVALSVATNRLITRNPLRAVAEAICLGGKSPVRSRRDQRPARLLLLALCHGLEVLQEQPVRQRPRTRAVSCDVGHSTQANAGDDDLDGNLLANPALWTVMVARGAWAAGTMALVKLAVHR